ncbi:MAG: 23S rRNA pseudouridine(955/2504/2580) synthase, partial [Gammaproteobacteria bacterium]|nr:23S rRNA pseudouridine(955/2504/2580) synthase [Gammaproteobacteria bacterium]
AAHMGHAIAGDEKYMLDDEYRRYREQGGVRLMLHAHTLIFRLPGSSRIMRVEAPYDDAFAAFLASRKEV